MSDQEQGPSSQPSTPDIVPATSRATITLSSNPPPGGKGDEEQGVPTSPDIITVSGSRPTIKLTSRQISGGSISGNGSPSSPPSSSPDIICVSKSRPTIRLSQRQMSSSSTSSIENLPISPDIIIPPAKPTIKPKPAHLTQQKESVNKNEDGRTENGSEAAHQAPPSTPDMIPAPSRPTIKPKSSHLSQQTPPDKEPIVQADDTEAEAEAANAPASPDVIAVPSRATIKIKPSQLPSIKSTTQDNTSQPNEEQSTQNTHTAAGEMISVVVEKLESKASGPGGRKRNYLATEMFPVDATANDVCVHVSKKYGANQMGLWLLQERVSNPQAYSTSQLDDKCYVTIKDSKYTLQHGKLYYVVHFTGSDIFIFA